MYEPDSRAERLAAALDEFIRSSPDVEAAAVVSFDGLPMASALPAELEEDRVGAMSAALLSLGEQAAMGLGRGMLNQVFVEGEHGFVFLMSARDQAVLTAIAGRNAKIGFMLFEMRRAADRIGRALESGRPGVIAPEANAPAPPAEPAASAPPRAPLPTDLPERGPDGAAPTASGPPPGGAPAFEPVFGEPHQAPPAPDDAPPVEQHTGGDVHHLQPPRSAASE